MNTQESANRLETAVMALFEKSRAFEVNYYDFHIHGAKPVYVVDYRNNAKKTVFNDFDDAADFIDSIIEGFEYYDEDRYGFGYDNDAQ